MEKYKNLDEQKQVYASVIAEGDLGVGRILKLLKELEIDDNTMVIFSSDNGPEVERGPEHKFHDKEDKEGLGGYYSVGESGGLKGEKRSLFAGGIRVPFIVRWPAMVPAGQTDRSSVVTAVDLLPTFLEVAGIEPPEGYLLDGESMLKAFKGIPSSRQKPIYWEWRGGVKNEDTWPALGIRKGKWKLLYNPDLKKVELYDIQTDWLEKTDLSEEYPEIVMSLKQDLMTWKSSLPTEPRVHCVNAKARGIK